MRRADCQPAAREVDRPTPAPGEHWGSTSNQVCRQPIAEGRSALGGLPEVLPYAVMVQSAQCMFDPALLVAMPGTGQNTADPYRQGILASTTVLVADGGDRVIRGGGLHCNSPTRLGVPPSRRPYRVGAVNRFTAVALIRHPFRPPQPSRQAPKGQGSGQRPQGGADYCTPQPPPWPPRQDMRAEPA
jgi:hypothetical protein